jgi:two-component system NtrC family sensor kinase
MIQPDFAQNPPLVLVVDDQKTLRLLLRRAMESEGYRVQEATDGKQCLELCRQETPDIILLDAMMPEMDGFECSSQLSTFLGDQCPPILIITVLNDEASVERAFSAGASDYVTKPIQWPVLRQRVKRLLASGWAVKQLRQKVVQEQQLTAQLEQKNHILEQTIYQLKQAQAQLVQTEKMSSLGQLVAGMAHEINNPVNFISGNLDYTEEYTQNLLKLVQLYQQYYPEPVAAIQSEAEQMELEFIESDLPKLLSSMKVGVERIQKIIVSLRSFSRIDEANAKPVDIHEGIDSTLLILENRLKAKPHKSAIQVIKKYGNLPPVQCFASQLNQVFMNILSNGIDALEEMMEKQQHFLGTITISTMVEETKAVIRIADNGPGMSEVVQQHLFDPFFTTKPVGKGTGLGMAISYQIVVNKHGGELSFISTSDLGTEFIIKIPLISQV